MSASSHEFMTKFLTRDETNKVSLSQRQSILSFIPASLLIYNLLVSYLLLSLYPSPPYSLDPLFAGHAPIYGV